MACGRPRHDLIEHPDHALRWERRINLDHQAFPYAFVQHIEGPESSPAVQRIAHKIHGPHRIRLRHDDERLTEPDWQPLLRSPWQYSRSWRYTRQSRV